MIRDRLTPENAEFVIFCFEGPDPYSLAGGLGVRINHLSATLAAMGFKTHLFFVGDPDLRGEEIQPDGRLVLHRWCQWISNYYRNGVYDGEMYKVEDFDRSIPEYVTRLVIEPILKSGRLPVILGEEWQTAETMCLLSESLPASIRDRVIMFWNANNTFSFERIDWERLKLSATITTVSRYMKHIMWGLDVNPLVIPNGIPRSLLNKLNDSTVENVRRSVDAGVLLCKVARWHPDKQWQGAIEAVALLKQKGMRPVLVARGGIEPYGEEMMQEARSMGLKIKNTNGGASTFNSLVGALREAGSADIINVQSHLPLDFLRFLYKASDGVLANSQHEPFGIVGLETMAVGGLAFTGCTGEDYAIPFVNSFVLETSDPAEIVFHVTHVSDFPEDGSRIRKAAKQTARHFTWEATVANLIAKIESQARTQGIM